MSDFDDFLKEADGPQNMSIPMGRVGLRFQTNGNRQPLCWSLSSLIPKPPHDKGAQIVQGNVSALALRDACLKAISLVEQEKVELLQQLELYEHNLKQDPDSYVRTVWVIE